MEQFRTDNTEGYNSERLAELNRLFDVRWAGRETELPGFDEAEARKVISERVLADYDRDWDLHGFFEDFAVDHGPTKALRKLRDEIANGRVTDPKTIVALMDRVMRFYQSTPVAPSMSTAELFGGRDD